MGRDARTRAQEKAESGWRESNFPRQAIERLGEIPVIVLDPKATQTSQLARVAFTTATYGINVPGTVYRMDDVAITLRPALESSRPSDQDVLSAIRKRLAEILADKRGEVPHAAA